MSFEFKLPDVGEGIHEGTLVSWKVKVGDTIQEHQTLCEVETDKSVVEIPSPKSAVVEKLNGNVGDVLKVGSVIAVFSDSSSSTSSSSVSGSDSSQHIDEIQKQVEQLKKENPANKSLQEVHEEVKAQVAPSLPVETVKPVDVPKDAVLSQVKPEVSSSNSESISSPIENHSSAVLAMLKVRQLAKQKGIDLTKVKPTGNHSQILENDLMNLNDSLVKSTDLSSSPVLSSAVAPAPGSLAHQEQAFSKVGSSYDVSKSSPTGTVVASPYLRRKARELGIDITKIKGTGAFGRIVEPDLYKQSYDSQIAQPAQAPSSSISEQSSILKASQEHELISKQVDAGHFDETHDLLGGLQAEMNPQQKELEILQRMQEMRTSTPSSDSVQISPSAVSDHPISLGEREHRTQLTATRKAILRAMNTSVSTIPHSTVVDEVDVTQLVHLREEKKKELEEQGIHLTYLPFVIKSLVAALHHYPTFNSSYDPTTEELIEKYYYNIGVAMDAPKGLTVPVLKDADKKSIIDLSRELFSLAHTAHEGKLQPDQMKHSTFSITSMGSIGGIAGTPIINYPNVAILGVYRIRDLPRLVEGELEIRKVMNISITFDHRIVDGADALRFMNLVKEFLEDPSKLILELF